jgi:ELWxxDGT repeat protein
MTSSLLRGIALASSFVALSLTAIADDQPYLVRDLPGLAVKDSMPYSQPFLTTIGKTTWFFGETETRTLELYRTDGTTAGTARVTYETGRPDPDSPSFLGTIHGKLVYGGLDAGGSGLFAVDTAGGQPFLLARIPTLYLTNGVLHGETLFFAAQKRDSFERELWRTDGTAQGTAAIELMPGGEGAFDPVHDTRLFAIGDAMFFFGVTPQGSGLHRTDGTPANTTLLFPLSKDALSNDTGGVFVLGSHLLFYLDASGDRKGGVWATDGTAAGTSLIAENAALEPLGVVDGKLLFDGYGAIWTTDGTAAGTRKTDLFTGQNISSIHAGSAIGNHLYFFARGFSNGDWSETLYVTEGTAATTRAIVPVDHHSVDWLGEGFVIGDRFYFRHDDGVHGMELWTTDGTHTGMVLDINPGYRRGIDGGVYGATQPDGRVLFVAIGPDTGQEPWITDGTAAGTRILANLAGEDSRNGSSPSDLRASGDRLFFTATLTGGQAIGVSDGSSAGTSATLVDFGWTISSPAAAGGRYFFTTSLHDLYTSDGTLAGTTPLFHGVSSSPRPLGNGVMFSGEQSTVWFSDGTPAGTRMIHDPHASSAFLRLFAAGDVAWFSNDSARLWKTDGTEAGTIEITPSERLKSQVYSVLRSGASSFLLESGGFPTGPRLWTSDGTSAGTRVVKVLDSGSTPELIGATGHLVYFTNNGKLQRSDGTEAGTIVLPVTSPCAEPAVLGDTLVFTSRTPAGVLTVWRSDGTEAGTTKLATMTVRNSPVFCAPLVALGNVVYFAGWDAAHGWEPWRTDGTVAGTRILADLYPGTKSSSPAQLTIAGDRVFFSADSPYTGRELWAIGPHASWRRRAAGGR